MRAVYGAILLCAGCCGDLPNASPPSASSATQAPAAKDSPSIYIATADMVCATDADFLDSSPLLSPANFAQVKAGTMVFITYVGGIVSGKRYYALSAGSQDRIYVYRDDFKRNFRVVEEEPPAATTETIANTPEPPAAIEAAVTKEKPAHQPREWVDATGKFRVMATFVSFGAGVVAIRKEDGELKKLPIDKLSEADQEYVRSLR